MNQFFYSYEANGKKLFGCFNIHYVIRAAEIEPGQVLVVLDDGHEEAQEKQVMEKGKPVIKRERTWVLSQILLVGEDIERFKRVMRCSEFPSYPPETTAPAVVDSKQLEIQFPA